MFGIRIQHTITLRLRAGELTYPVDPGTVRILQEKMDQGFGSIELTAPGHDYPDMINVRAIDLVEREDVRVSKDAKVELHATTDGRMYFVDPFSDGSTVYQIRPQATTEQFAFHASGLISEEFERSEIQLEDWFPPAPRPDGLIHIATWRGSGRGHAELIDLDEPQLWLHDKIRPYLGSLVDNRLAVIAESQS